MTDGSGENLDSAYSVTPLLRAFTGSPSGYEWKSVGAKGCV